MSQTPSVDQARAEISNRQSSERSMKDERSKQHRERLKKEARKVRRRQRADRVYGDRSALVRLVNEYSRAAILRIGKDSRKWFNRVLAKHSMVGDPAWFERDQFPWMKTVEDGWEAIRAEADRVVEARDLLPAIHEISPDHDRLSDDGTWKTFFLYGYGIRMERSCARCPETAKLLESVPGLSSAFFSILAPGSHLPRHRGPTKAIVTWHLGLRVPRDRENCWIEVDRQRRLWTEGESLIFDDAQKHEVRNDTDEERVVLLIHFARPLRFPGSWVGAAFMRAIRWSPFVRDGERNNIAWEEAFEVAMAQRAAAKAGDPSADRSVPLA